MTLHWFRINVLSAVQSTTEHTDSGCAYRPSIGEGQILRRIVSQRRYDRLPQIMGTHSVAANGEKRVNDTAAADPTKEKKSFARTWTRTGRGQRGGKAISPELLAGQTPCPRSRSVAFGSISGVVVERIKPGLFRFCPGKILKRRPARV